MDEFLAYFGKEVGVYVSPEALAAGILQPKPDSGDVGYNLKALAGFRLEELGNFDRARIGLEFEIPPQGEMLVATGLCFDIPIPPEDSLYSVYQAIVQRTGWANKGVIPGPLVVDPSYRPDDLWGLVMGIRNHSSVPRKIPPFAAVAQAIFQPVLRPKLVMISRDQVKKTERGPARFGGRGGA